MERCQDHDKIVENYETIAKDTVKTSLTVARMEEKLDAAIKEVGGHIAAGSKWRLTILCACIGLVGTFIAGVVRFGVMEYKVEKIQEDLKVHSDQIYDLNYEKGRAVGLQEAK
jgi:uncharacterized UBP type Zn finger protein